jgi:hypothetical protein
MYATLKYSEYTLHHQENDFNERLGHCYIFCNALFVFAVGLNLNIWISFYIKIGKQAENPYDRQDTLLFDKYFECEIQQQKDKIHIMVNNADIHYRRLKYISVGWFAIAIVNILVRAYYFFKPAVDIDYLKFYPEWTLYVFNFLEAS